MLQPLRDLLEEYGYPLVAYQRDGVLVCKNGTWAFGFTLNGALLELRKKLIELGRVG